MGDRTGNIRWWDVTTGQSSSFNTHREGIRRIKFSPVVPGDRSRGRVAVLFYDNTFSVFDLVSLEMSLISYSHSLYCLGHYVWPSAFISNFAISNLCVCQVDLYRIDSLKPCCIRKKRKECFSSYPLSCAHKHPFMPNSLVPSRDFSSFGGLPNTFWVFEMSVFKSNA